MNQPKSFKVVPLEGTEKYTRLLKENIDTLRLKSGYVILQPGESVGEHSTENKEEIIIILEGEAEVIVEGNRPAIVKGKNAIYVPPQKVHNIKNIGQKQLKYVFIVSPATMFMK